ncbi:MAG: phosphoribosylanthranilate isomerase [Candidatus Binatia bacterium]
MTLVKICGVTSIADAVMASEAGADAIGLNFHPASPRCVTPETAAAIAAALPARVWRVGVFVDLPRAAVADIAAQVGLDVLQFHGSEPAEDCGGWGQRSIKAVRVRGPGALLAAAGYPVDFILADAYVAGAAGGTGQRVPLEWLTGMDKRRLLLAGGLNPDNVADVVRQVRPAGVDVASGVERAPGVKDAEKVKRFIDHAKSA